MGKICTGRVIGGGMLAGLVINIFEFVVNGVWFAADWEQAMKALGKGSVDPVQQLAMYVFWGFVLGVLAVWQYAAIRPRFGAGPRTAAIAALVMWLPGYVLSLIPPAITGIFPMKLMLIGVAVGLVEMLVGTQLGAYLYREEGAPEPPPAVARGRE